ncbi:MAG: hypothetical protein ICV55_11915, partial [Coleofasciculus sp. C3-bin4]|nr:hypothetical protein [Coleofasciculus sp. C3-bin4]
GAFQAISSVKQKIQDSKAIASLKSALLNLFDDGDDGGNQPIDSPNQPTDPTPETDPTNLAGDDEDDDDEFELLVLNGDTGECLTTDDLDEEEPQEASEEEIEEELIHHPNNERVAYIFAEDGKLSAFVGFDKKSVAHSWLNFFEPAFEGVELGAGAVMESYKYELRFFGLSMAQVSKLAALDFTKKYHVESDKIGTAKPPESKKKYQLPTASIGIGSKVTRLLTPSESFEVTSKVASDGTFFAKSVLNGDRQLFNINDVVLVAQEGTPRTAEVLLAGDEWQGQRLEVISQGQGGYTLRTPKGDYWYSNDSVQIVDADIEAIADATEPTEPALAADIQLGDRVKLSSPCSEAYRKFEGIEMEVVRFIREDLVNCLLPNGDWHPFSLSALCLVGQVEELILDTHSILGVGDIVEVVSDRYPQYLSQVGAVEQILQGNQDTPIQVRCPRGAKLYRRNELKFISKAATKELVAVGGFDF